jgi:hypothetical protein
MNRWVTGIHTHGRVAIFHEGAAEEKRTARTAHRAPRTAHRAPRTAPRTAHRAPRTAHRAMM